MAGSPGSSRTMTTGCQAAEEVEPSAGLDKQGHIRGPQVTRGSKERERKWGVTLLGYTTEGKWRERHITRRSLTRFSTGASKNPQPRVGVHSLQFVIYEAQVATHHWLQLGHFLPLCRWALCMGFCTTGQKSQVMFFIKTKGTHWPINCEEERDSGSFV